LVHVLESEEKSMSNLAMVDQKGRLKIPVTLFPMLKRSGTELYVTSEEGYSVRIYPMQVWNHRVNPNRALILWIDISHGPPNLTSACVIGVG